MKKKQIQKYKDLLEHLPNLSEKKILDVGCGPRWLEYFLKKKYKNINYVGTDIDYKPNLICSGNFLPFKSNSFDAVFCLDVVHILNEINELKRTLKKGGVLVISEPISLFEEDKLNSIKNLKIKYRKIIGDEEKDILLIYKK